MDFLGAAHAFIEALATLIAQPAALHHAGHECGHGEAVARRIAGRQHVNVIQHVGPNVETDDIHQAKGGAFGKADQRTGERIGLFHGVIARDGKPVRGGAKEAAYAVGDEIGRILARHHALAQAPVAEGGNPSHYFGEGVGAGDDLNQVQVARRIEEVGTQEMRARFGGPTFRNAGQRNPTGIGGENRAGPAKPLHAIEQGAFRRQILNYGFHDPFAFGNARQVLVESTGTNQAGGGICKERARSALAGRIQPLADGRVRHVQQLHRIASIGEMGRDARPHGPGAQHGNRT